MSKEKKPDIFPTWAWIPGYEGEYQVSDMGRVRSVPRVVKCSNGTNLSVKGRILKAAINSRGYRTVSLRQKDKYNIAPLMAMAFLGHKPNGHTIIVDHINNIRTDDRLENIQLISHRENRNKDIPNKKSKYPGVFWHKQNGYWTSQISINGKRKHLGIYDKEEEAAEAYEEARRISL